MSKTIKLFNARANEAQDAELSFVNGEHHATFADGHFIKFPGDVTAEMLRDLIALHNEHNKPAVTQDMLDEQKAKAESIYDSL